MACTTEQVFDDHVLATAGLDAAGVLNRVRAAIAGKSHDEILATLDEKLNSYWGLGCTCSETSFMALRDVFGLPDGGIRRALTAFPGLGLRGETCGAVTASMVGIGLVYGRDDITDASGLPRAAMPAVQLCETVKSMAGSTQCGDILEAATGRRYDFLDKEGAAAYFASPEALQTCFLVVQTATHTAADLLIQAAA